MVLSEPSPTTTEESGTQLCNNRLCGKGFDDKICICSAIEAVKQLKDCDCEIILQLSSREEIGRCAASGAYNASPDYAIVLDVTGAAIPEEKYSVYTSSVMGQGPEISLSVLTDASLTKKLSSVRIKIRYRIS